MSQPAPGYIKRFRLSDAKFTRIDHHDTMIAEVYRTDRPSKPPLILKICDREVHFRRELYFLTHFASSLPVPKMIDAIEPQDSLHGAILMECLPGALLQEGDWTEALAHVVGTTLARIHSHSTDGYGDITTRQNLQSDSKIYFGKKFREELSECHEHLPYPLIERCERYFVNHIHQLESVDGPCIVHRDYRPGNMIVADGKLQGIIDWAGGRSGFAEQDFVPMNHRNWPSRPEHKKSLLEGYASIRPVPDYEPIMPLLRLARSLAVIGYTVKSSTWKTRDAQIYTFNREFLEGVVIRSPS